MKTHQKNKKTNEQPNGKVYFQRLMILMVAIMASTALVGCDIINDGDDPDDPGSTTTGKIDQKLVGEWEFRNYYSPTNFVTNYCTFRSNGTFLSHATGMGATYTVSGNYTTSNGWITLSNVVARHGSGLIEENHLKTYRVEYRFEKNPDGKNDYLNMGKLLYSELPEIPLEGFWARWTKK